MATNETIFGRQQLYQDVPGIFPFVLKLTVQASSVQIKKKTLLLRFINATVPVDGKYADFSILFFCMLVSLLKLWK